MAESEYDREAKAAIKAYIVKRKGIVSYDGHVHKPDTYMVSFGDGSYLPLSEIVSDFRSRGFRTIDAEYILKMVRIVWRSQGNRPVMLAHAA